MRKDTEEPTPSSKGHAFGWAALALTCAGWLVALIFGDGFELHRSALAMPFVVLGAFCGLIESWRCGRTIWMPAMLAGGLALLYFSFRSLGAPVWDLGRYDLHLVSLAWLTMATLASCVCVKGRGGFLLIILIVSFVAQLATGLYQQFVDPSFVFLRFPRSTAAGVSGLFWHWNNLGAYLAIVLPIFLGVALTSRQRAFGLLMVVLVVSGVVLAYLSKSRAGFAAVVIGLGSVGALALITRSRSWSFGARLGSWSAVGFGMVLAIIMILAAASRVSADRGHGADLDQALGKSLRFALAGAAYDLWLKKPIFGNGSQSYRYQLVENWDAEVMPPWVGNPETVHNEYLQALTDYGLIGFLLIIVFFAVILGRYVVGGSFKGEEDRSRWREGLGLGAIGGVLGVLAQAVFDFQLHLLPIVLLLAIAVGLLVQSKHRAGIPARISHLLSVVLAAILAITAVGRESLAGMEWLRWEMATVEEGGKLPVSELPRFKELLEASPHYEAALSYGRMHYTAFLQDPSRRELLEEAGWALAIAYERNPQDPATIITHALILDLKEEYAEAEPVHLQALKMAHRRENKYGAMAGMSRHLLLKGEALRMKRNPEEALGNFLMAKEYLLTSYARGYKFGGYQNFLKTKRLLETRINMLQIAGIQSKVPRDVPVPQNIR